MGVERRASQVGSNEICTIIMVDINQRAMMNLHKVPLSAKVQDVKKVVSDRLRDVGRPLSTDVMVFCEGTEIEKEIEDHDTVAKYNPMSLSKITFTILKRQQFLIEVVAIKIFPAKCKCMGSKKPEEHEFTVRVPSGSTAFQLSTKIAKRMNCDIDPNTLFIYADPGLGDLVEGSRYLRAEGIKHKSKVYVKAPPNFNPKLMLEEDKAEAIKSVGRKSEFTATLPAAPPQPDEPKSELQKQFEAKSKKGTMSKNEIADFARSLGYAPSLAEVDALAPDINFTQFQDFLGISMHADDNPEQFKEFFDTFDTQVTGDISKKQLVNILQMYGSEPLSAEEAKNVGEMIMGKSESLPIKVIVDTMLEGAR